MKNIRCQNSVEYYDYFSDSKSYYIVMEKCDENLENYMQKNKSGLSEHKIKEILLQLNKAFKVMRAKNIIHRDLKPQNILLKYVSQNQFIVKIADFGLSREFNGANFSTLAGTPIYFAPEILNQNGNYMPIKCDLWAIGVIIYKLKFNEISFDFYKGKIPMGFDDKNLDDLVRRLIVVDPNKRISWDEYFNHQFFKN